MLLPYMGDSCLGQLSDGMSLGANASISHTTKPRPMNTHVSAPALSDEQLESLNGSGVLGTLGYIAANAVTFGGFSAVDLATGGHIADETFLHGF